jgi:hypothetical protein
MLSAHKNLRNNLLRGKQRQGKEVPTLSRGKYLSLHEKVNHLKEENSRLEKQLGVLKGKFQEGETSPGLGTLAEIAQLLEKSGDLEAMTSGTDKCREQLCPSLWRNI